MTSGSFGMTTAIFEVYFGSDELVDECKRQNHLKYDVAAGCVGGGQSVCRPIQKAWDPDSNHWQPLHKEMICVGVSGCCPASPRLINIRCINSAIFNQEPPKGV